VSKPVIFSVKAGHTTVAHVRDLVSVLTRERAEVGVLITMLEPTRPMREEAAGAGFYTSAWGKSFPRVQLLTVGQLLAGKGVDMPPLSQVNVTYQRAPRELKRVAESQATMELQAPSEPAAGNDGE
jgi:hypothetical protein